MIKFEHGMLVLDNTATKDDVNAINEFAEFVRNSEQERIIKLIEENTMTITSPLDNSVMRSLRMSPSEIIALIKGEQNG